MSAQTWGKWGAQSVCKDRFKSHSRTEHVEPHQPHRKNSIYNQKVQNNNIRSHRSWPRYRTGTHSTHTLRKLIQGIKQPPSNTDTRKATIQHSISALPVATHQSQLGGAQNTNRDLAWISPGVPRSSHGFKPKHWGAGAKAGGLCTPWCLWDHVWFG